MENKIPVVSILITTHNRTNVAKYTIQSLINNVYYPKINWIVCDDRSEENHIKEIEKIFLKNNIVNFKILKTDNKHYGLGASLNNGLKEAFKLSEYVLTTEDDWVLERKLNIACMINVLQLNKNVGSIRLAAVNNNYSIINSWGKCYKKITSDGRLKTSTFNLQVAIRHKRVYDQIGFYKENVHSDICEQDFIKRYNSYTNNGHEKLITIIPNHIKENTLDDESLYFIHVGRSTVGHEKRYKIPYRYKFLYNEKNISISIE